MYTISEYLWKIRTWNDTHELKAPDLQIAQAMLIDEDPTKRDFALDRQIRFFQGRYYTEIDDAYKDADGDFIKFVSMVEPLYAVYREEIEEYEESKAAEEEKEAQA